MPDNYATPNGTLATALSKVETDTAGAVPVVGGAQKIQLVSANNYDLLVCSSGEVAGLLDWIYRCSWLFRAFLFSM